MIKMTKLLIASRESEKVEFKSSFGKGVIETLCAFANHKGGTVILGAEDSGRIAGVNTGAETIQGWINQIKQKTDPVIIPTIEVIETEERKLVLFPVKPVANSNHRLSLTEIANLHLSSLQLSWDSYEHPHSTIDNLDANKIQDFIDRVKQGGRLKIDQTPLTVLKKLGFLQGNTPSHAAMLLFGEQDPQYSIHIGRFKSASTIIDDRMIRGTLFQVVKEAMRFILSHLKVAFEISDTIERKEIYEYPLPAIRELLLNAVVHRDYTSPVDTQIKIFDQSITFFNPGKLFGDITIQDLDSDTYQSRPRNRLIAEAFYLRRDIEKYGSGFIRIRKELLSYHTMLFSYKESGDGFLTSLSYREQIFSTETKNNEGTSEGISEGIKLLLQHIKKTPGQRTPQLAAVLNIPAKTIERWIRKLREEQLVEFRGSKKAGGYYFTKLNLKPPEDR